MGYFDCYWDYGLGATEALLELEGVDSNCPTLKESPFRMLVWFRSDNAVLWAGLYVDAGVNLDFEGILRGPMEEGIFYLLRLC